MNRPSLCLLLSCEYSDLVTWLALRRVRTSLCTPERTSSLP